MKKLTVILFLLSALRLAATAQYITRVSYADSLYKKIDDKIYDSFYSTQYMGTRKPAFNVLKVDINKKGKVTDVRFSDSADSAFIKAYNRKSKYASDKELFEKYAKAKKITDASILVPISFEPENNSGIPPKDIDNILMFKGVRFAGKSYVFPQITIRVLNEHNM